MSFSEEPLESIKDQNDHYGNNQDSISVWDYYNEHAAKTDADILTEANETAGILLTFAGLFSAAVAAFIAIAFPKLSADPNDTLVAILQVLSQGGQPSITIQKPPVYGIRVNAFLFGALSVALVVAVLCIFINQWARNYQREIATQYSSPHHEARARFVLHRGMKRYDFIAFLDWLSVIMLLAVFLAMIGIFDLIFSTCPHVGYIPVISFTLGIGIVLWRTLQAIQHPDAPFRSPLSRVLGALLGILRNMPVKRQKRKYNLLPLLLTPNTDNSGERGNAIKEYVKSRAELDLEIIIHNMLQADKTTERWLLDRCFKKIPSLTWVSENVKTSGILSHPVILGTSVFLTKTCVQAAPNKGDNALVPTRFERAQTLAQFIVWFLWLDSGAFRSKAQDPALITPWMNLVREHGRHALSALSSLKPTPEHVATKESLITAVCTAYSAIGLLEHIPIDNDDTTSFTTHCGPCSRRLEDLRGAVTKVPEVPCTSEPKQPHTLALFQAIVALLSMRGDCMRELTGCAFEIESEEIVLLIKQWLYSTFYRPSQDEIHILLRILETRSTRASEGAKEIWFRPLLGFVRSINSSETPETPAPTAREAIIPVTRPNENNSGRLSTSTKHKLPPPTTQPQATNNQLSDRYRSVNQVSAHAEPLPTISSPRAEAIEAKSSQQPRPPSYTTAASYNTGAIAGHRARVIQDASANPFQQPTAAMVAEKDSVTWSHKATRDVVIAPTMHSIPLAPFSTSSSEEEPGKVPKDYSTALDASMTTQLSSVYRALNSSPDVPLRSSNDPLNSTYIHYLQPSDDDI
ncbi:hypothetical protein PIIN_07671 [Serendipita indica DSM 11827]|uniref:DUF6535 domain-containing protein n=1 Tax=Serendipita indica (strain DSM 11827) TaxID=1109443 RepID=G4TQX3_SERID|nr:hypothetical protein PIIN_07671 [Serendipita indica DSM 11827]